MPDSLYGARLQGITVVVFIVAKSRAWFDEYIYRDSLESGIERSVVSKLPEKVIPKIAMRVAKVTSRTKEREAFQPLPTFFQPLPTSFPGSSGDPGNEVGSFQVISKMAPLPSQNNNFSS